MGRAPRISIALILAFLAGVLAVLAQPNMPAAHAGESGRPTQGNYVAFAKPVRVFGQTITGSGVRSVTALGVQGIPRTGTTGLQVMVSMQNYNSTPSIYVIGNNVDRTTPFPYSVPAIYGSSDKGPVVTSHVVPVDDALVTNQLSVWDKRGSNTSSVYVAIDVVGYYTRNAVGGGYVAVNPTFLFDTRGATAIPAGGDITVKLTGGNIPETATAVFMDLFASGTTAQGTIIAVPYGTDTVANPVLRLWTNAAGESDLVAVKLGTGGQVTFKNTSTAPVHLTARAEGYVTDSPTTGADWQVGFDVGSTKYIEAGQKADFQVAGGGYGVPIPATGVAASFVQVRSADTTAANCLRIYPSGTAANPQAVFNCASSLDTALDRISGLVVPPGTAGSITIENLSSVGTYVSISMNGWFAAPTNYATAGGDSAISRAKTSAGPCYAYLDPNEYNVRVGCVEDDGQEPIYSVLSPMGESFTGSVQLASRQGGRVVVVARHAPDGEVWTWEFAHTVAGPNVKPVRTFRYVKGALAAGTTGRGDPVAVASDGQGTLWGVDLNVTSPAAPIWMAVTNRGAAVTQAGELRIVTEASGGVTVLGTTSTGHVIDGSLYSIWSPQIVWSDLGGTGAVGKVDMISEGGMHRWVARRADNTIWSFATYGWAQVNTTYNGSPIQLAGSPTVVYDPYAQRHGVLFRSDATPKGELYVVWEATLNSADFSGPVSPVYLDTMGIATDVTAWDYRAETPLSRRWSAMFLDRAYGKKLVTSVVP